MRPHNILIYKHRIKATIITPMSTSLLPLSVDTLWRSDSKPLAKSFGTYSGRCSLRAHASTTQDPPLARRTSRENTAAASKGTTVAQASLETHDTAPATRSKRPALSKAYDKPSATVAVPKGAPIAATSYLLQCLIVPITSFWGSRSHWGVAAVRGDVGC